MALLTDELGKPRWGGGGLLLLALLVVLLVAPLLRSKDSNHPLSGEQAIELCPFLPNPPAPWTGANRVAGASDGNGSQCGFRADDQTIVLSVALITTRQASAGAPQRTSAMYQTWLKEVVASGAEDVRERSGTWAMASSYRFQQQNQLLVEDRGVMLTLSSTKLGADALTAYAQTVVSALRKPSKQNS
jgi:hypothetical protein